MARHSCTTAFRREAGRAGIVEYIEGLCNPQRRHSTFGQINPAEFERQFPTRCT